MITPSEFKFTVIDGGSSVITNICEDKIQVEKDDEGNRFFALPNPYYSYDEVSRFKRFLNRVYTDRDDLAYQTVLDGYADTICTKRKSMLSSLGGINVQFVPIVYLNEKIGRKKRKIFKKEVMPTIDGFVWIIKYMYADAMSDTILRNNHLDIIQFNTEEDAKKYVGEIKEEVIEKVKEIKEKDTEEEKIKIAEEMCDKAVHMYGSAALVSGMISHLTGEHKFVIRYATIPKFHEENN